MELHFATNLAWSLVKRDWSLKPILFFITKLYFSSSGIKFSDASFLHFISLSNNIITSEFASKILGAENVDVVSAEYQENQLPDKLIVWEKTKLTPLKFPRRDGVPKKSPLIKN